MNYRKYIIINPKVMTGKPVIAGTRIPVDLILKKLARNMNVRELLRDYPRLSPAAVRAALEYEFYCSPG
ncbi:DUF433 domain-containing protein [Candidatus Collierbacteria bacterium]|nr:DUF433 domain-containing protein [Candidatus Collierbacteria bacterium]